MAFSLQKKKILIIDDEQTMVDIVRALIKKSDGVPYGVTSAKNAFRMTSTSEFDLIILDRYLSDEDGLEVLKELKSNERTKYIPVLMLTGERESAEIQKSVKLGASGYIVKPFQPRKFLQQVAKILNISDSGIA